MWCNPNRLQFCVRDAAPSAPVCCPSSTSTHLDPAVLFRHKETSLLCHRVSLALIEDVCWICRSFPGQNPLISSSIPQIRPKYYCIYSISSCGVRGLLPEIVDIKSLKGLQDYIVPDLQSQQSLSCHSFCKYGSKGESLHLGWKCCF